MSRNPVSARDVRVGTTFRSTHADSNPLWRVVKARGGGTWDCVVDESEPDWAGTRKVFGSEEILRSLKSAEFWKESFARHSDFWDSVTPGTTLHYHDAFGRYVRGVAVKGKDREGKPAVVLKPVALVGTWEAMDLPRWHNAGFFQEGGYHVKKIAEGETFQPNSASIYESPDFVGPMGPASSIDPTKLAPIDLSHPEPTAEQAEANRLLLVLNEIRSTMEHRPGVEDFRAEYRRQINEIAKIVSRASLDEEDAPSFGR